MSNFMVKVKSSANKVAFEAKKHAPTIAVIFGIVSVTGAIVTACKATTKVSKVIDEAKEDIDKVHKCEEAGEVKTYSDDKVVKEPYTEEDKKKDLTIIYTQAVLKVAKAYGPAIILYVIGVGSIIWSHTTMLKRNMALTAALATVSSAYSEYREKVIEKYGKEVDDEFRLNLKAKECEKIEIDEEGNETRTKETINTVQLSNCSEYARYFDETCNGWDINEDYCLMFLHAQETYANNLLQANGYLFLNEVYEMLGIPKTKAGQVVGWVWDPSGKSGDNFVDFGIRNVHRDDGKGGYEEVIVLDFNVDGNIWEKKITPMEVI